MNGKAGDAFVISGVLLIVLASSAFGFFASTAVHKSSQNAGGPYLLQLVITTNNWYNNTVGYQPSYFVVKNGQLMSAANITVPANVPIEVEIVCYDNGSAYVPASMLNVTGTVGDRVLVINDTNVNATYSPDGGISVSGGAVLTSFNASDVAHTFTIFYEGNVLVNIPVSPLSTEFAVFTLPAGHYTWQCEATCGSGPGGVEGAMSTPGWMNGIINAVS
jgi:heme/copper-type cytochrome/quinol oxidase subunit 2